MSELLHFMGEHPFITIAVVYLGSWAVVNSIIAFASIFRPEVARYLKSD